MSNIRPVNISVNLYSLYWEMRKCKGDRVKRSQNSRL